MIGRNFQQLFKLLDFRKVDNLEKKRSRLFPNGKLNVEDERVTASIFLAILVGIKQFRELLISSLASPGTDRVTNQTAQLHAYNEISEDSDRPDGLLVLTTGKKDKVISWAAYLEVKTKSVLDKDQVDKYLKRAKKNKIPAVITISNEFVTFSNINPTGIKNDNLFHWSWNWIISKLSELIVNESISDEDQVYLAHEFIDYLKNHNDIKDFSDMGEEWESSAKLIVDGQNISRNSENIKYVARAWSREEKDIATKLSTYHIVGFVVSKVSIELTREERSSETKHFENLILQVDKNGELKTRLTIHRLDPNIFPTVRTKRLSIALRFRGRKLVISMRIPAKSNAKAVGQTSYLLKQLIDSGIEDELMIKANFGQKQSSVTTLKLLREQNEYSKPYSIISDSNKRESIKEYIISYELDLGRDFYSRRKVIKMIEDAVTQFYVQVPARFMV